MIPPPALAAVSAAVLAYEVLLVRLFAIVQWHHFAFMAISVALLGFGISGALIVLLPHATRRFPGRLFTVAASIFAATAPAAFLLAQGVPFNALEVVWSPSQLLRIGLIYLLLAVPFTAGAACIGLAFRESDAAPGRVYLWNLLGSGAGALGIVGALFILPPLGCLGLVGALGLMAAFIAAGRQDGSHGRVAVGVVGALCALSWWAAPAGWTTLRISEFKGLPQALAVQDAKLVATLSGPVELLSVVESPAAPLRYAPGLSMNSPALPPPQLAVFADGAFAGAIDLWDGRIESLAYLAHTTDALVYALGDPAEVLVLSAGGTQGILQPVAHGAATIDATEDNPDMLRLVGETLADRAGRPLARPEVRTHLSDARSFLAGSDRSWDAIILPSMAGAGGSPTHGLDEDFLMTAEGLALAFRRLTPTGWLSATVNVDLPPRVGLKLVSTLGAALSEAGAAHPREHLLAIRSLTTMTVLAKRAPVTERDIDVVRTFATERGFDLVHHPRMSSKEANRRTILTEPVFFNGVRALLGPDRDAFAARYRFDIAPARDDRPYINDTFKWAALPDLLALGGGGGAALIELGEPIVAATLVQAALFGAILALLPLRLRLTGRAGSAMAWRFGIYFTTLGLAFLFVEIAWIQKFQLFLGHPLYSVSAVLAGFLVFAALGAGASGALDRKLDGTGISAITAAVSAVVLLSIVYLFGLPRVFEALSGLSVACRFAVSLALIAPLAFFMGMPFPLGLARVSETDAEFVPWAWGLNGCASVVSSALAILISMHLGIAATIGFAAALYALAAATLRARPPRQRT